MKTYNNPRGLRLGDRVIAKQVCTVAYAELDRRLFFNGPARPCFVTGVVKKALGKYVAGNQGLSLNGCEPDYDPPYLKVSCYIWLYECRTSITSKPFLVHPNDIGCNLEFAGD